MPSQHSTIWHTQLILGSLKRNVRNLHFRFWKLPTESACDTWIGSAVFINTLGYHLVSGAPYNYSNVLGCTVKNQCDVLNNEVPTLHDKMNCTISICSTHDTSEGIHHGSGTTLRLEWSCLQRKGDLKDCWWNYIRNCMIALNPFPMGVENTNKD